MSTMELLRSLKYEREKARDRVYDTFETNYALMLDDVIPAIERLIKYEERQEVKHVK